jgi:hypothetical protein
MQKEEKDKPGRINTHGFKVGDLALMNARNLALEAVNVVERKKALPRLY